MTDWVQTQTGPNAPLLHIGRWEVRLVPHGWVYVPDFGIRKAGEGMVPSNVAVNEDTLLCGDKLALYLDAQIALMKNTFKDPMIAGPRASRVCRGGRGHASDGEARDAERLHRRAGAELRPLRNLDRHRHAHHS